ncbi:hypothetical protein BP6252_00438 [Coleophoma cylindrospora]|uniref:Uncharacterized protein n=1 Tax=Coleophoma cylindrospora TaxID=1849047 RepID=A0A3D8SQ16_9HELO|nr:hypothetical protein BP6252_00438 [Coleophoma cylindrospora]
MRLLRAPAAPLPAPYSLPLPLPFSLRSNQTSQCQSTDAAESPYGAPAPDIHSFHAVEEGAAIVVSGLLSPVSCLPHRVPCTVYEYAPPGNLPNAWRRRPRLASTTYPFNPLPPRPSWLPLVVTMEQPPTEPDTTTTA